MKSGKNAGVETGHSLITRNKSRAYGIALLMILFLLLMPKVSFAGDQLIPEVRLTGSPTSISAGTLPDPNVKSETAHVKARVFEYYLTALKHGYDWRWWNENEDYWDDFRVGKKSEYHYHTPIAYADGTRYGLKVWITTDEGYSIDKSTKIYFNNQEYNNVGKTKINCYGRDSYLTLDLGIATGTANLYTIKYDSKGGSSIPSQTVEEGHLSALWQSPKKDACTFLGWYLDEEGKREFDNKEPIRENMTLYAKWRVNKLLPEIRLYSDTTVLSAGVVPIVKVKSTTEQVYQVFLPDSNEVWQHWDKIFENWEPLSRTGSMVAKKDGTVYGLWIQLFFQDGYYVNEKTKVYFNDRECLSLGHTAFYPKSSMGWEYAHLYLDYGRVGTGVFSERNEDDTDIKPEDPADKNSDSSGNSESAGSSDSGISGSSNSGSSVSGSSGSSSASGSSSTGRGSSSGSSGSSSGSFSGGGAGSSSGGGGGAGSSSGGGGGASGVTKVSSGTAGQVLGVERASFDGKWMQDAKGWWIQYADGSYPKNEWKLLPWNNTTAWYFFDEAGYMKTGWLNHNGKWYFLSTVSDGSLGAMKTGWLQDAVDGNWYYLDAVSGEMKTGWQEVSGKLYYLNTEKSRPFGAMYRNEKTPDGMQVDESGAKIG